MGSTTGLQPLLSQLSYQSEININTKLIGRQIQNHQPYFGTKGNPVQSYSLCFLLSELSLLCKPKLNVNPKFWSFLQTQIIHPIQVIKCSQLSAYYSWRRLPINTLLSQMNPSPSASHCAHACAVVVHSGMTPTKIHHCLTDLRVIKS